MRVHLIKKQSTEDYIKKNVNSHTPFNHWLSALKFANWEHPNDIKSTFGTSDLLGNNSRRVVFDIGGNNYRMICKYVFGNFNVYLFICWIGTHAEYDKICRKNEQYTIFNH
jgi:mRNA interferase HigB